MSYIDTNSASHPAPTAAGRRERAIESVVTTLVRCGGLRDVERRDIEERVRKTLAVQRWRGLIQDHSPHGPAQ